MFQESAHPRYHFAETLNTAYSLYKFGKYQNPFAALPTGPSAHVAPTFPVLVAGLYTIFGDGPKGSRALALTEAGAILLEIGMLPAVSYALGADPLTGLIAAVLATCAIRRMPESENNYVGLLLLLATLLACRFCRILQSDLRIEPATQAGAAPSSPWRVAWLLGAVWGVVLLTNPTTASIWVAWLALGAWQIHKSKWRSAWRYAWLPALLLPLLLIWPWTVRNYFALGGFVPVRSNLGLELRIGNNPCAAVSIALNARTGCNQHPSSDRAEARKVAQAGEIQYNRTQMSAALAWIRQNPRQATSLWVRRAESFWFPSDFDKPLGSLFAREHWLWRWTVDFATLLSLPGLVLLWRQNRTGAVICALFLLIYPLTYYFIQYDARYRFPIIWVSFVLAALALSWLVTAVRALFVSAKPSMPTNTHVQTA